MAIRANKNTPAYKGGTPVRETLLPPFRPSIGEQEIKEVVDTLRSDWITTGPKVRVFEERLRSYLHCKEVVALSSCTAALHLSLVARGIGEGDEVITTPFTFISTANVIVHERARPVFVDIEKDTYTIDPALVEKAITKRTKAIILVHYAGQPGALAPLRAIARKHNLFLLEDAAHAFGATYKGRKIGETGDAIAFSFYPAKNLTTGEGGALATSSTPFAKKIRLLSLHGMSKDAWKRYSAAGSWYYEVVYPGYKCNMTDMQAALGIHQLKKFEPLLAHKRRIAALYDRAFASIKEIVTPKRAPFGTHTYYLYPILIDREKLRIGRDEFIEALRAENIGTSVHFIPVHLHPYYRKTFGFKRGDFPVTEYVYDRVVSLPVHARMSMRDARDVIAAVKKIVAFYKKP